MKTESTAYSVTGRRLNNEDAHFADDTLGVYAVADGMGGREGGEIASQLAIQAVERLLRRVGNDPQGTWPFGCSPGLTYEEGLVDSAIRFAHQMVESRRRGDLAQMGTTMALLLLRDGHAILGHVGDSRIYRLRDGRLTQLTRDHSLYDELLAAGATHLPPREKFPYANVITRVLGDATKSQADLRSEPVEDGDVFLLCSDGLTESLSAQRIAYILAAYPPAEAGQRLVREAYLRGAYDNITAVVVGVTGTEVPRARFDTLVEAAAV